MKRILSILFTCTLLISFSGGVGFITVSCTPEQQPGGEQPGTGEEPGGGEEDTPSVPGAPAAFSKFISTISKGENLEIPLQGEWKLLYKGFKAGDKITITMVHDSNVTFTLTCTKADDENGAFFTIPTRFIGGNCKVVAEAGGRTTQGTCFVKIVDEGEVEKKSGYTTYGRVVDYEGNPVSGVTVSDGALVTTTDAQGGSASGIGGLVGASYNQATLTVNGCIASCDIKAPAGSTAFMLVGVVGSNKSATTMNVFGTAESPNVIKGGSITLGDTKVAMTAENFLTYALPWGTGKSVNANISSNTVWN
jgi:hypothetical protein